MRASGVANSNHQTPFGFRSMDENGMASNWHQNAKKFFTSRAVLVEIVHTLSISLFSLLLPLSFLLLARFSSYNYFLVITSASEQNQFEESSFNNPSVLYALVSFFTVFALIRGLTGRITFLPQPSPGIYSKPHLCAAWIILCAFQICVRLGVQGSGMDGLSYETTPDEEISLWSRMVFFLGLHETMLHWSGTVVKPMLDDTVYGGVKEERWVAKAAMAVSFGGLWWWRLRDEVEALVAVAEAKREAMLGLDLTDLVGCWLYYITVIIGMVRIVKGVMWFGSIFLCRRRRRDFVDSYNDEDKV